MLGAIISLIVAVVVCVLFGYLATMYDFMAKVFPWILGITIAVAAVAVIIIIIKIVKEIRK